MSSLKTIKFDILKLLRKANLALISKNKISKPACIHDVEEASQIIYAALVSDKPCMIARFGAFELSTLTNYIGTLKGKNSLDYIKLKQPQWWWQESLIAAMNTNAGFFPPTVKKIEQYCKLVLEDIPELDILGSWLSDEVLIEKQMEMTQKVHLMLLEPFWSIAPWTSALIGKKVVVIHPFAHNIEQQYLNRRFLFRNENVLPDFKSLTVIQAVQTIGEGDSRFKDWFEALEFMKSEIDKIDYDVCLIGCGAYGFHLAAHVKRNGKKGIHLGGALQLLFGIKGRRWEDSNYGVKEWGIAAGTYSNLMNDYWIKPDAKYKPKSAEKVEGACYW